jgi:hypothetical protein
MHTAQQNFYLLLKQLSFGFNSKKLFIVKNERKKKFALSINKSFVGLFKFD